MRRAILLICLIVMAIALPAPASAQDTSLPTDPAPPGEPVLDPPRVAVGIGDNSGSFLDDPLFLPLGIRKVRLIVPYDVVRTKGRRLRDSDGWLRAARDRGLEVLVAFGFSQRRRLRWHLPSAREYRLQVRAFMRRYPWIHTYSTWNEANHKRVQPTGTHPVRTAILYRVLRRLCVAPACQTVAADVLLTGSRRTWRWIRAFKRRAGPGPHVWGVHNYPDANRMSTRQTRRFLRTVKGEVWFTETGGIVRFGRSWKRNEHRAARAVRQAFRLAELSDRVKRIYIYSWRDANRRWDSALITRDGRLRAGYRALLDELTFDRFNPKLPPLPPPAEWSPLSPEPSS